MVASGLGVSVLPALALQPRYGSKLVREVPFTSPAPSRKVAIAWRVSFARPRAIEALAEAVAAVDVARLCRKAA